MITLANVNVPRGNTNPHNIGFTSNVIPKAIGSQTGVSVRYEYTPNKQWYVVRVSYGRINKAKDILEKKNLDYYLPLHYIIKTVNNKRKRIIAPLLPNLLFVYAEETMIKMLMDDKISIGLLSFYYNHFVKDRYGKNPPLTVEFNIMAQFIDLTSILNEHIKLVDRKACNFKSGDYVRVINGDFKGIEGRVARVYGQQRVVVELNGLCLVATAYIPTPFIERI